MSDKPILFSAPMVRAILEDRKTQTRRIMKVQPDKIWEDGSPWWNIGGLRLPKCPYGQTGGALWVRETFRKFVACDECGCSEHPCPCPEDGAVFYRADENYQGPKSDPDDPNWKPSIFMPRIASRITLEIKDIRAERLNDISEEAAKAEGAKQVSKDIGCADVWSYKEGFKHLWHSINGPDSWHKNPWVWVVSFDVHPINIDDFIAAKDTV